jgi:hypothetical protein
MVGIGMAASLKVRGEPVGHLQGAGPIEIPEPLLPAIRLRKPAEEMVKGPILHHNKDDVVNA